MDALSSEEQRLIEEAKSFVHPRDVRGGSVGDVGCVLITENGERFVGVSLHLPCGIGFCAEHTAVSQMVTQVKETRIRTIVACTRDGVIPPCGRCRELLNSLDSGNLKTEVIVSDIEKMRLAELLPRAYEPEE